MKSRITLNPVVLAHGKRPDGSYNVKIRLTYKRVSRILPTQLTAAAVDVTKTKPVHIKAGTNVLLRAQELIKEMYTALSGLEYAALEYMEVDDVARYLSRKIHEGTAAFRLDFFDWAERYAATKGESTGNTYRAAVAAFRRYIGTDALDISEITTATIRGFIDFINAEPVQSGRATEKKDRRQKKKGADARYTRRLQTVYNAAKDTFNDEDAGVINIPRDPFRKLPKFAPYIPLQRSKDTAFIQKAISYRGECTDEERTALDLFILSFGLMGINAVDLLEAQPPKAGVLEYRRRKTRTRRADEAFIAVKVDSRLKPFIERNRDATGARWLNLYNYFRDRTALTGFLNRHLKRWAARVEEEPFTFYAARHSWATIARNDCRIDKATVDECLNHVGNMQLADVYIKKDWRIQWDVNKKVLDLFTWTEKG